MTLTAIIRKSSAVVSAVVVGLVAAGCTPHSASYNFELREVIQPEETVATFGTFEIESTQLICENHQFRATWDFSWSSIDVDFMNLSKETFRVVWDECVFVDAYGTCHHIVPSEILYRDIYENVKPAKVPPGCSVAARLIPRDNIRFVKTGWIELPYLPKESSKDRAAFENKVKSYLGKSVEIVLAVESSASTLDYLFVFEIIDAKVKRGSARDTGRRDSSRF